MREVITVVGVVELCVICVWYRDAPSCSRPAAACGSCGSCASGTTPSRLHQAWHEKANKNTIRLTSSSQKLCAMRRYSYRHQIEPFFSAVQSPRVSGERSCDRLRALHTRGSLDILRTSRHHYKTNLKRTCSEIIEPQTTARGVTSAAAFG